MDLPSYTAFKNKLFTQHTEPQLQSLTPTTSF